MLFPHNIIRTITECAHWADRLIRSELIIGEVVSETDYTSNFTGAFRREINSRHVEDLTAKIQVLNPASERKYGADGCIILQNKTHFKVGLFEAKWPRLRTQKNAWDSIQKSSGDSHFHSQLSRQQPYSKYAAIWEMFYSEFPFFDQPPGFPDEGSACLWHSDAFTASVSRTNMAMPWNDTELLGALDAKGTNIADIIEQICLCLAGTPMPLSQFSYIFPDGAAPHSALVITYGGKPIRPERFD